VPRSTWRRRKCSGPSSGRIRREVAQRGATGHPDLEVIDGDAEAPLDAAATEAGAQWLFTVGAPIVVAIAAVWPDVDKSDSGWALAFWLIGLVFATYGVAGTATIMTTRADFEID